MEGNKQGGRSIRSNAPHVWLLKYGALATSDRRDGPNTRPVRRKRRESRLNPR